MNDWLEVLLLAALVFAGSGFWAVWRKLDEVLYYLRQIELNTAKIIGFSLNPRTRVGQVTSMQSAPHTEEQQLRKVGRIAASNRVVVGGDEDSELNQQLRRSVSP